MSRLDRAAAAVAALGLLGLAACTFMFGLGWRSGLLDWGTGWSVVLLVGGIVTWTDLS